MLKASIASQVSKETLKKLNAKKNDFINEMNRKVQLDEEGFGKNIDPVVAEEITSALEKEWGIIPKEAA